ncbi:Hypothetical protein CINCED_3A001477 [Cinara cedri]|uniref:Uncharacterized protein n=1 Tax=Cinara cedri TaxID=506608 RepID=A0A5E4MIL9_9HEMI|nr:Hypothetical protein CINCED_3A001477 [Cinara cedri]
MHKYAVLSLLATVAIVAAQNPDEGSPLVARNAVGSPAKAAAADDLTWAEVIECYKKPRAAIGCLQSRMDRALVSLRDSTVNMARSDPDTQPEDVTGVGELVQQIGEFISYGISTYFNGEEDEANGTAGTAGVAADGSMDVNEGRGHHKKKKIQKEIKKFVLKILFGVYLIHQKIKMILMSIQSILMSKFLIVAMIYALSNTFKIWYDIKKSKHHHHDKVVYYENAHHQHHYEPPEHTEEDEHHHGWGSDWGRSITVEPSVIENRPNGPQSPGDISRFIRRVSRTAIKEPADAQTMAFGAQRPARSA